MPLYLTLKSLPELKRRMWRERRQAYWQMGMKPLGNVLVWLVMAVTCAVLLWAADTIAGNLAMNAGEEFPWRGSESLLLGAAAAAVAALLFYRHVYFAAMRQYLGYATFDRWASPLFAWIKSLLVPAVSVVFIVFGVLALDWAINISDAEPVPAIAKLKQWPDPIPSEGNGFIAAIGLMAAPKESPLKAGAEWIDAANEATLKRTGRYPQPVSGLQFVSYETVHGKPPGGDRSQFGFCRPGRDDCLALLAKEHKDAEAWVAANPELLSRYLSLKKYPQWQQSLMPDMSSPVLQLRPLMQGQNLMQTSALLALDKKKIYLALLLIGDDIRFLRNAQAGKNALIVKMVAATMLARDYALVGELMAKRHDMLKPYSWMLDRMLTPLTGSEISLHDALRFEEKAVVGRFENAPINALLPAGIESKLLANAWGNHHVKRIATLNMVITLHDRVIKHYTMTDASQTPPFGKERVSGPPLFSRNTGFVYNIGGKLLAQRYQPGYHEYANRMADLNALNRLVRLRLSLAIKKVAPEDVPDFLADEKNAALQNPETGKPFEWDAHARVIYFTPASTDYRTGFNFGDSTSDRVGLPVAEQGGKKGKKTQRKG